MCLTPLAARRPAHVVGRYCPGNKGLGATSAADGPGHGLWLRPEGSGWGGALVSSAHVSTIPHALPGLGSECFSADPEPVACLSDCSDIRVAKFSSAELLGDSVSTSTGSRPATMLRRQGALCRLATTKTNRGYSTLTNVCIAQRRSRDRVWVAHSALPGAATRLLTVTVPNDDTGGTLEAQVKVGAESQVVKVSIKKPLGFVLAGGEASITPTCFVLPRRDLPARPGETKYACGELHQRAA